MLRIAGPVKTGIRLIQTGFQHLEYLSIPFRHLIPVAILDAGSLDLGHLADLLGSKAIGILAADPGNVPAVDRADQ